MSTATPLSKEQVAFVVYLPMKPEQKARGRAMLMGVVKAMSREPDFINTWVHEKQDDPDVVVLYEAWACLKDEFISSVCQAFAGSSGCHLP